MAIYESESPFRLICDFQDTEDSQNMKANALLIAAAPDLLEAGKKFVAACESAPPVDLIKHISDACETMKAAIRKATHQD